MSEQRRQTSLTLLNAMAGPTIKEAIEQHLRWGLRHLDLKDRVFGKGVCEITDEEAGRLAALVAEAGMRVHCLSTPIFQREIETDRDGFSRDLNLVRRTIEIARRARPTFIRLLSPTTTHRTELDDAVAYVAREHGWLLDGYRKAIDLIAEAGFAVTIENEVGANLFASPHEVCDFFDLLDRPGAVSFTWDVQNMWQCGTFPSAAAYEELRPLMGYYHLKGGMCEDGGTGPLRWRSSLEDASWPVADITARVIAGGVSPVICLNPSHGERKPDYDYDGVVERDISFLRNTFSEVE